MEISNLTNKIDQLNASIEEINKRQAFHEQIMQKFLQAQTIETKPISINTETQTSHNTLQKQTTDDQQYIRKEIIQLKNMLNDQQANLINQLNSLKSHIQEEMDQKSKIEQEYRQLQAQQVQIEQAQMLRKAHMINTVNKNDLNKIKIPKIINFNVPKIIEFKDYAKGYEYYQNDLNLDKTSKVEFQNNYQNKAEKNNTYPIFQVQGVEDLNFTNYQTKQIQIDSAFQMSSLLQNQNVRYDFLLQELEKIQ